MAVEVSFDVFQSKSFQFIEILEAIAYITFKINSFSRCLFPIFQLITEIPLFWFNCVTTIPSSCRYRRVRRAWYLSQWKVLQLSWWLQMRLSTRICIQGCEKRL